MTRTTLLGAIAVCVLGMGSIAVIGWGTGVAPAGARSPPATAAEERSSLPPGSEDAPQLAARVPAPRPATYAGVPAAEPSASPRTPPPVSVRAPGRVLSKSIRREITKRHGALGDSLAACAGPSGRPRGRPLVLTLELESLDREVRIVDAQIQTRGDADEAIVACAQEKLRNQVVDIPTASAGHRYRMPVAVAFH